ncbi:unnamed protein product, partial [Mesorhabditis belari]|uniref:RRM domain-containing protein n=1 Tax=Mesorhabditis belari TaxID=2138241 RepID=A0AAF3FES2_9BILA
MEDWGCVTEDIFGGMPSSSGRLDDIVDALHHNNHDFTQIGIASLRDINQPIAGKVEIILLAITVCFSDDSVEIHRCDNMSASRSVAPKILKKKKQSASIQPASLKKVKFEVEKLVIAEGLSGEEKEAARTRMAVSLGAAPEKRKHINYKKFKITESKFCRKPATKSFAQSLQFFNRSTTGKECKSICKQIATTQKKFTTRWVERVIGVFNLSKYTSERQLTDAFRKFGDMEKINLIYDRPTGQSRGFAFISFVNVEDARRAKEEMGGSELDGHKLRVDYSVTKRAHSPTPGVYLGMKAGGYSGERGGGRHGGGRYNGHNSRHHFSSRFRGSSPPNRPGRFRHSSRSPRGHPDRHHRRRTPTRAQYRDLSRSRSGSPIPNY